MFVYFIFYDDYNIYDVENDHQNVILLRKPSSSSKNENNNDICTLCLDDVLVLRHNLSFSVVSPSVSKDGKTTEKDKFIFRDLTKYNYHNHEYIHTCDCRPCLHCACLIDIYLIQESCLICKKDIHWKYGYYNSMYNLLSINTFNVLHILLNVSVVMYFFIIIYNNTSKHTTT